MTPGVNFTNVLCEKIPKAQKWQLSHLCLFALLGLTSVKAECKTLVKLTPGHCWGHTLLWRGTNRVVHWPYTYHHAGNVHHVSEHHHSIGNNCLSEDDWLLAYLLLDHSFGHLFPWDILVYSEEKRSRTSGSSGNQRMGHIWKIYLANQEESTAIGHSCTYSPLYVLLLLNSFSICMYVIEVELILHTLC